MKRRRGRVLEREREISWRPAWFLNRKQTPLLSSCRIFTRLDFYPPDCPVNRTLHLCTITIFQPRTGFCSSKIWSPLESSQSCSSFSLTRFFQFRGGILFFFVDEDIDEANCLEACEVLDYFRFVHWKRERGWRRNWTFSVSFALKNYILLLLLLIILLIINKLSCRVVSRMLAFQSAMMFRRRWSKLWLSFLRAR